VRDSVLADQRGPRGGKSLVFDECWGHERRARTTTLSSAGSNAMIGLQSGPMLEGYSLRFRRRETSAPFGWACNLGFATAGAARVGPDVVAPVLRRAQDPELAHLRRGGTTFRHSF